MTVFLLGMVAGALLVVVACVVSAHFVDRPARRIAHEDQQRVAFRQWCERVGWCPVHNVDDGTCPLVEVTGRGSAAHRFEACPGSAVLRPPATPSPTGTRLETWTADLVPTVWEYTAPEHALPGCAL